MSWRTSRSLRLSASYRAKTLPRGPTRLRRTRDRRSRRFSSSIGNPSWHPWGFGGQATGVPGPVRVAIPRPAYLLVRSKARSKPQGSLTSTSTGKRDCTPVTIFIFLFDDEPVSPRLSYWKTLQLHIDAPVGLLGDIKFEFCWVYPDALSVQAFNCRCDESDTSSSSCWLVQI